MFMINVFCALTIATPTPLWGSDPVEPGETALLFGEGMSHVTAVEMAVVKDPEHKNWVELEPIQVSDRSVKVLVPEDWEIGVYAWRAKSQGKESREAYLNQPELWWVHGDAGMTASPGGWLRVFGKCLAFKGTTPKVVLKNPDSSGCKHRQIERELPLISAQTSLYALKASLPAELAKGRYTIRIHNGLGGELGWSKGIDLEVRQENLWPDALFNVVEFGAVGSDGADDTEAIRKAIEAAEKAEGGVVYFPRGRYRLSGELHLPRFVMLKGEGRELVTLYWDDADSPPEALIQGTNSFGIENLTIACANYVHVIASDLGSKPDAGDVFIRRIRVRANIYLFIKEPEEVHKRFTPLERKPRLIPNHPVRNLDCIHPVTNLDCIYPVTNLDCSRFAPLENLSCFLSDRNKVLFSNGVGIMSSKSL